MAKTLSSIIAGPIGLIDKKAGEFISGTILTVAGVVTGNPFLVSVGTFELGQALTPTPPKPGLPEEPKKSPTPVRRSGYGAGRMQPSWVLYEVASNGHAVDVYAFHDGRINRIIDTYIGDKRVSATNGGYVQELDGGAFGKNSDNVIIGWNMGLETETAFGQVIAIMPEAWDENHRGDGVVTGYMLSKNVKSKNWQSVYSLGGPNQAPLSLSMERQLVYDWRDTAQSVTDSSTWKYSENIWLHLAHYLLIRKDTSPPRLSSSMTSDEIAAAKSAYWARVGSVWAMKFQPTIDLWTAAANDADSPIPLNGVQTLLASKAVTGATSINLLSVNGLHSGMSIVISVSGNTSYDETRTVTGVSGNTVSFSGGLSHDHILGSGVTWSSDPANPATEPRYRGCVTHSHNEAHKDVIKRLLSCGDGYLTNRSDGAYVLYSGRYVAPTVSVGPDDILTFSIQIDGVNEEDSINTLKVTYVSANHDFSVVDTDDWVDEDALDKSGKELSDSFQPETPSFSQNRRLAKREMADRQAPYRGSILISGRRKDVREQRYINIDLTEGGMTFYSGPVKLSNGKRILSTGAFQFDWVAADPNIDEWNPATEEGLPAPVGNRVAVVALTQPVITSASPNFGTDSATGVAGVFIDLTAEGLNRDDLIWFVRTRQAGYATWGTREYDDIDAGASVELASEFVPTDASIEVEVSYQTGDGRVSDWSDTMTVDTSSANVPPARVTGFAVTSTAAGSATATYNTPNSSTLAYEKLYRSTSNSFSTATLVDTYADPAGVAASHTFAEPTGATRYYWCTTISTGGAESTPVGPVGPVTIM